MLLKVIQERLMVKPSLPVAGTSITNKQQGEWAQAAAWGWGGFGKRVLGGLGGGGFLEHVAQGSSSLLCRHGMPAGAVNAEHIEANKTTAALKTGKESKTHAKNQDLTHNPRQSTDRDDSAKNIRNDRVSGGTERNAIQSGCCSAEKGCLPDHVGLAIKQHAIVADPSCVCEVVLAGYEVEDARCPVSNQQRILHHRGPKPTLKTLSLASSSVQDPSRFVTIGCPLSAHQLDS